MKWVPSIKVVGSCKGDEEWSQSTTRTLCTILAPTLSGVNLPLAPTPEQYWEVWFGMAVLEVGFPLVVFCT